MSGGMTNVRGHDEFGLSLLAVPVVAGKTTYHSHIMVNKIMSITRYEPREYLKGVTIVDIEKSSGPPEQ